MAQRQDRRFVGSGKRVKDFDLINFSVCLSDIPTGSVFEYKGKQYVKLVIGGKREVDSYGKTHSVWLDPFKPDPNRKAEHDSRRETREAPPILTEEFGPDDLPF